MLSNVLIVEDNECFTIILQVFLKYVTNVAQSKIVNTGAKAIEQAETQKYNVILVDMNLPDLSGVEVIQAIRKLELDPMPKMVIMSSSIDHNLYFKCNAANISEFTLKPESVTQLAEIIDYAAKLPN